MEQRYKEILLSPLRQSNNCERTGERKWKLKLSGSKQHLQVAKALVQFLSSLPCCKKWTEGTHCTCQYYSYLHGSGQEAAHPHYSMGLLVDSIRGERIGYGGNQHDANTIYMTLHNSWSTFLVVVHSNMFLKLHLFLKCQVNFTLLRSFYLYSLEVFAKSTKGFRDSPLILQFKLSRIFWVLVYWLEHVY